MLPFAGLSICLDFVHVKTAIGIHFARFVVRIGHTWMCSCLATNSKDIVPTS